MMYMTEHPNTIGIAHFRDYIKELPHQWILDNLISSAGSERRIVSSAMVKEAAARFAAKTALAKRFKALPPPLRLRCAQVYLMGQNGLGLADPAAYAKEPLLGSLLVFAAQNGSGLGGARLFGFDEFEPALRPLFAEALFGMGAVSECAQPPAVCPWRPLNDVAVACSLALHGGLSRSSHGGLSRSALNSLKRLVHDATLTGKSNAEGAPGHPSGFLIGFCLGEGLIVETEAEYALNRQKFAAWLEKSMKDRLQKLAGYAGEFLGGFGLDLLRELLALANGQWVAVNSLVPEADRPALVRALSVLEFFGRAHAGSHGGGVRFTLPAAVEGDVDRLHAGERKRDTLIMPDFSVVIPLEASPSELFDFAKIGQFDAFDKVYKGRITKESVSNALSAGVDPSYLREWLRGRRASANVARTVDEWIREFMRLFVSRGSFIMSSDEKVTRQIASLEPLRKHITEVSAHTFFAIRPGSEQKALDILEKLGFDTRAPGGQADAVKREEKPVDSVKNADNASHGKQAEEAPPQKRRWEPLTDFSPASGAPPMNRTKYGSGLKPLEMPEMIQVVDYAILTSQSLVIDYAGSAYIKQGIHTVTPVNIDKGVDAAVEAEMPGVRGRKHFYLCKIRRIAVVAQ